jgi:hypothetical protein
VSVAHERNIGIDFGTSTTLVSTKTASGRAAIVPIGRITPWLPSVFGCEGSGRLVAGEDAEGLARSSVVRSVKLAITRGKDHVSTPGGTVIAVEDAVRAILMEAVSRSAVGGAGLDADSRIALGCPAMWQGRERQLLVQIANDSGIPVALSHVIDEPIAAGVAWIEDRYLEGASLPDTKVLVFDPGGGTLDVALLHVRTGTDGVPEITVLAADGSDESGDSLDEAIAHNLASEPTIHDLIEKDQVVQDLLVDRSRELKELLSSQEQGRRPLGAAYDAVLDFDRTGLERVFEPQWIRTRSLIKSVVRAAKLREQQTMSPSSIRALDWDEASEGIGFIVLVGGLSQVPVIRLRMGALFPLAQVILVDQPQQAVVRGLALSEPFERLNLHRPAFNFSMSFFDEDQIRLSEPTVVYPAFTPLYEPWEVVTKGGGLGYACEGINVPERARQVLLHCATVDGNPLRLLLDGEDREGVLLPVAPRKPVGFKLYVNGDIVFGQKGDVRLRVKSWPTLRGSHHQWRMEIERVHRPPPPPIIDEWRFLH